MMGYRLGDIATMKAALEEAEFYLPPSKEETRGGLILVMDLLDGLIEEGRIND